MKTLRAVKQCTLPWNLKTALQPEQISVQAVKAMEHLGAALPLFGSAYSWMFYRKMLKNELSMAGISPGMKAMHIGCGPFPMTAMMLGRFGAMVTAVDVDRQSLLRAAVTAEKQSLYSQVQFVSGCGTAIDYSGYSAIWISLHARPVHRILNKALTSMDNDARIIIRNPRGMLCSCYDRVKPEKLCVPVKWKVISQPFGKISIMLKKA